MTPYEMINSAYVEPLFDIWLMSNVSLGIRMPDFYSID